MDIDTSCRRKRPIEEEEYLASKRYLSEKFFNMRISHPDMPGMHGASSMWQGAAGKAAAEAVEDMAMCDGESPPAGASLEPTATSIDNNGGFGNPQAPGEGDVDAATEASGGPPTPHPIIRSASSMVDEKVDDWVRTSRHRMLADASVNSAPDLCRALILYKPVTALPPSISDGAASAEGGGGAAVAEGDGDDGEGGGDPTPSPQSEGDGGGETAPFAGAPAGLRAMAARGVEQSSTQSAGSSTAEAAGFTGGGERTTGQSHGYPSGVTNDHHTNGRHHHHRVAGSLFGTLPRGLCTAQSGGDDAGGTMLMRNDSSASMLSGVEDSGATVATRDDGNVGRGRVPVQAASVDAMDMDAGGDQGAGGAGGEGVLASLESEPPEPPVLTRVGTSRGVPTPDLTAERVSWARTATQRRGGGQDQGPDEIADGSSARPPLTAQAWVHW